MGGRRALQAKIIFCFHQPSAKQSHPDSIHSDTSGQWIGGTDQPAGQIQPATSSFTAHRRQEGRTIRLHRFPGTQKIAPCQNMVWSRFFEFLHDHRGRNTAGVLFFFISRLFDSRVKSGSVCLLFVCLLIHRMLTVETAEGLFGHHQLTVQFTKSLLLFFAGNTHCGTGGVDVFRAVKECKQLIVVPLSQWVVFVSMALGATDCESQPDGSGGIHPVDHGFHAKLFVVRTAFLIHQRVAVKPGCNQLIFRRCRQKITGDLFDRELIERHVLIECLNHPVTPRPDGPR